MKVSIILPVYNVEKYLSECLESVLAQTLDEIEVIAVNDGSTDNSLEILNKYSQQNKVIKIINQENRGQGTARNIALKVANGDYIYFLDSDDYINNNAMKECYIEAKKTDADIITFDACTFNDDNFENNNIMFNYDRKSILGTQVLSGEDFYSYSLKTGSYRAPIWLCFYKKEFLANNCIEFPEGIVHEDELFSVKAFLIAKKIKYIPKDFFFRRLRFDSTMTKKASDKNVIGYIFTAEQLYNFYINNRYHLEKRTLKYLEEHINNFYYLAILKFKEGKLSPKLKIRILKSYLKCRHIINLKRLIQILIK